MKRILIVEDDAAIRTELMPFAFPLLMTVPIAGIYGLYFVITYRIACNHVRCRGGEKQENFS